MPALLPPSTMPLAKTTPIRSLPRRSSSINSRSSQVEVLIYTLTGEKVVTVVKQQQEGGPIE